MLRKKKLAVPASVLVIALACAPWPISMRPHSTSAPAAPQGSVPGATAESISAIPLHVGYGAHAGSIDVYFTDPANPASVQDTGGVDAALVEAIDGAQGSVHLAMYSLSLNNVRQALIRAHRRGVDVRLVTESDNIQAQDLQRIMEAGIPVLGDRREGSMHDKFMVIDSAEVWTGSMNYTVAGAYQDNNVVVHVRSPELAREYENEFTEMFSEDRFGPNSGAASRRTRLDVGGTIIDVFFAPDDGPEAALVELLDTAQHSVLFLAYSFTSNPLGNAVRRAAGAGVRVRGIMDEDQAISNVGSELAGFRTAGLEVRLDGNQGLMHEKIFIVDGEVVVVGSYNFSRNANEVNDENALVIHSRAIAEKFTQEFERLYSQSHP